MAQSEHSDEKLSEEELLEIAKSTRTTDESERPDEVTEFILANSIKPSITEWIEGQQVYWNYRIWCIANKLKFKDRVPFHKEFSKRFNKKMVHTGMYGYGIEDSMRFRLTPAEWFKMRKQFRDEKSKKAKKRRKVPRPKPEL